MRQRARHLLRAPRAGLRAPGSARRAANPATMRQLERRGALPRIQARFK